MKAIALSLFSIFPTAALASHEQESLTLSSPQLRITTPATKLDLGFDRTEVREAMETANGHERAVTTAIKRMRIHVEPTTQGGTSVDHEFTLSFEKTFDPEISTESVRRDTVKTDLDRIVKNLQKVLNEAKQSQREVTLRLDSTSQDQKPIELSFE